MDESLIELLRWYRDMGVDLAVDATPHDRFADSAPAAARQEQSVPSPRLVRPEPPAPARPAETFDAASDAEALECTARERAAAARSLDELREALGNFDGCRLKVTATKLVFGDGSPQARVMFVGEAPGAEEDREGRPFVGRAGQLLDKMLGAIGLDRRSAYIANVVPWRPPGNRTPTPAEIALCLPFIRRQIELVDPAILVCLGTPSAQTLLDTTEGIMRLRGRWLEYRLGERTIPALPMLHPAYLLRQPAQKQLAWQDLRALARALEQREARAPATREQ